MITSLVALLEIGVGAIKEPDIVIKYDSRCRTTSTDVLLSQYKQNLSDLIRRSDGTEIGQVLARKIYSNISSWNKPSLSLDAGSRSGYLKYLMDHTLDLIGDSDVESEYLPKTKTELVFARDSKRIYALVSLIPCIHVSRRSDLSYDATSHNPSSMSIASFNQSFATKKNQYHPLGEDPKDIGIDDEYFSYQWYLGGPPEQPYGANIIRSWNKLLNRDEDASFAGVKADQFGGPLTIVVVDIGCGENDDILYDATHPECDEAIEAAGEAQLRGAVNVGLRKDDQMYKGHNNSEFCAIPHLPNTGHKKMESYFQDPAHHGIGTNSIIGAGWNDKKGIAGVCPFCRVKCIKIGSGDDEDSITISLSGIYRSLEFLATYHEQYVISNHSYGGFTLDMAEVEGHKKLNEVGHTVVTAAGNYSCDIDPLAEAFGAFDGEFRRKGSAPESECAYSSDHPLAVSPYMPGSINLPNKFDIGASTIDGNISQYSNWGKRSIEILAPGELIVSLNSGSDADPAHNGVVVQDGTSFSSPIVAGSMALLHRHITNNCGQPTPQKMWEYIKASATQNAAVSDKSISGGILNLYEAMKLVPYEC